MPTVLRAGSLIIAIHLRDEHEPPHVHVRHPDGTVIVVLHEETVTVSIRNAKGSISANEIRRIAATVEQHFEALLTIWSFYHR